MRLAIVGSVSLAGHPEAWRIIEEALARYQPLYVISGGAKGIDTMAAEAARIREIVVVEHRPKVQQWDGPGGFKERNRKIAEDCDALIRIVASDSRTYGSGWTRDRAAEMGKPTENFVVSVQPCDCPNKTSHFDGHSSMATCLSCGRKRWTGRLSAEAPK